MDNTNDHISVCICTYKRPNLLLLLLNKLQNQITNQLFTYSIVVVDNDHTQSAKSIVASSIEESLIDIEYYSEPEQNIALARNKAVDNAKGNFIAFIDDDEFPTPAWLLNLYNAYNDFNADGILGPVMPHFVEGVPNWIIKGKFCERLSHETGVVLHWGHTRTGNVLFSKNIFLDKNNRFASEFGRTGGEDVDFFKRMLKKGKSFVWCNEAPVYEKVPPERLKRAYFLKRALLRGSVNSRNESLSISHILKSVIAFSVYTLALPFFFLIGQHLFMKYLIKDCDHVGLLLGVCGINIVKERNF